MRGSRGEKLGGGVTADVHAWAPGRVVKLFKSGVPMEFGWYEAQLTRAVFAAGGPAPKVFGVMMLDGRFAMVLPRFDGPTLLQHYRSGAMTRERAGATLAALLLAVHKTPPPPDVLSLRDEIDGKLRANDGGLPKHVATGVLALIERLPPGDELCHGDVHPENVIVTAEGPRLIDWLTTVRAPAAFDLAWTYFSLTEVAVAVVDNPERPRAVAASVLSEYARLAGMSPEGLKAAMAPWLPIAGVRFLLAGMLPHLRERLIQRVEADLRATD